MSATIQVTGFDGTLKKLSAGSWPRLMGGAGGWESGSQITAAPYTLTISTNRDMLIIENDDYVEIKFDADSAGYDSQGLLIPPTFSEVKVTSVNGTVKILRLDKQSYNDKLANAYTNSNAVSASVNDILYGGDFIVCDKNGDFKVKFTLNEEVVYKRVGLDIIAYSSEAPSL